MSMYIVLVVLHEMNKYILDETVALVLNEYCICQLNFLVLVLLYE